MTNLASSVLTALAVAALVGFALNHVLAIATKAIGMVVL